MIGLDPARRRFARWALIATVAAFAVGVAGEKWFVRYWQVAFAPTRDLCLPWRVLLADRSLNAPVERGDLVWLYPDLVAVGASSAKLLPFKPEHRFVKLVAGVAGDEIEVSAKGVFINGHYWGELDLLSSLGRDAAFFYRKQVVPPDHYLVMGSATRSFDSRYWGPIPLPRIIGHAKVLY